LLIELLFLFVQLPRYLYIILGFIGLILVVNLVALDFFLVSQRNDLLDFQTRLTQLSESFQLLGGRILTTSGTTTPVAVKPVTDSGCPMSCVGLITMATISAKTTTTVYSPPVSTSVSSTAKGEYFVPLGSGSVGAGSDWTNIDSAQATFDAGSYGAIKQAYFEVFIHVDNGQVQARLFDATSPAVFWGSVLTSTSKTSQFLSAPIILSSGSKTYKVQMTSNLVSGVLDQARIRIVTQ